MDRMSKVFLFAGTNEGRRLAKRLGAAEIPATVSLSEEYGPLSLEEGGLGRSVEVLHGSMDPVEMVARIRKEAPLVVVDATHPFALAASDRIRKAAADAGVPCLRLKNKKKDAPSQKIFLFPKAEEVVTALKRTTGNILITTGVDTVPLFAAAEELKDRIFVRIPPEEEAFRACEEAGISGRQIIAMKGPFSREMNCAIIHSYGIRHLVLKQSGSSGNFEEKVFAAQETETALYIVGDREEEGISYAEVLDRLGELLSADLRDTVTMTVSIVGIGPGGEEYLTGEGRKAITEADVLFGKKEVTEHFRTGKLVYPYARGEEIVPRLEQLMREARQKEPHVRAAVLIPGDSGFCSGSSGLIFYLGNWRRRMMLSDTGRFTMQVRTVPGISSVQMLVARLQEHWDRALVKNLAGEGEEAWKEVLNRIPHEKRTFLIVSSPEDARRLLTWVRQQGGHRPRYSIYAGYHLSLSDEVIFGEEGEHPGLGVEDAKVCPFPDILPEGSYTVFIRNSEPEAEKDRKREGRQDTLGLPNEAYLQEPGVPITKEEIRTVALSKLRITEPSVIYDIGSGTGSFAVELGRVLRDSRIFAIEKEEERAALIRRNVKHLNASSVAVVVGEAPEILDSLTPPTHVIIGGSDGRLLSILHSVFRRSPAARAVILATTLETKAEITSLLSGTVCTEFELRDPEYIEMNLSRSRRLGKYRALKAENPVAILAFTFGRKPGA